MPVFNNRSNSIGAPPNSSQNRVVIRRNRDLVNPRSASVHELQEPLAEPPRQPEAQYKTSLRYLRSESERTTVQNRVDYLTQKNVSRNVKESFDRYRYSRDKKPAVGMGLASSSLNQLSAHRDRDRLAASTAQSQQQFRQIAQESANRDDSMYQFDDSITRLDVMNHMDIPKEFRKEFKEAFINRHNRGQRQPAGRIRDIADLNQKVKSDPAMAEKFNTYFQRSFYTELGRHYTREGDPIAAEKCFKNFRWRSQELSKAEDELIKQSADEEFQTRFDEASRNVRDIMSALRFQIDKLQAKRSRGEATGAELNCLRQLKTCEQNLRNPADRFLSTLDNTQNMTRNAVHARCAQRFDQFKQQFDALAQEWNQLPASLSQLEHDQASFNKASSSLAGHVDSKSKRRQEMSEQLKRLGNVLAIANEDDDDDVTNLSSGRWKKQLKSVRDNGLAGKNYSDREMRKYARILEAASKNDLNLGNLPKLDSADEYYERLKALQHAAPGTRETTFKAIDRQIKVWTRTYQQHAEKLKAKWKITRAALATKHWFADKLFHKKIAEISAFSTEISLAQGEAREAVAEFIELKAEKAEHAESGHSEVEPNHATDNAHQAHNVVDAGTHDAINHPADSAALSHSESADSHAESGGDKPMTTEVFVGKDILHGMAIIKNAGDIAHIQEEIKHKKHKRHVAHQKLEQHTAQNQGRADHERFRSNVAKHCYKKMGSEGIAMDRIEQGVGALQIARHSDSMATDIMTVSGVAGHGLKLAGAGGAFGGAVAEGAEGVIGFKKYWRARGNKKKLSERKEQLEKQLENTDDPGEIRDLKFQLQTIKDLADQQKKVTNALSSAKGFGMATGYTIVGLAALGITTAALAIAAPVLLGVFAATAIGLAIYKKVKAHKEEWKLNNTEDLMLGRGGDQQFLQDLQQEADDADVTIEQAALTRIARGVGPEAKMATGAQLLHQLKRETSHVRMSDQEAARIGGMEKRIESLCEQLQDRSLSRDQARLIKDDLKQLEQQHQNAVSQHHTRVMESPTATTLHTAYGMSKDEILSLVNAPETDTYDEIGARLISEYQQELI